jgi:uncharacterized protein YcfJ
MLFRKTMIAVATALAALAVSAPALADRGHRDRWDGRHARDYAVKQHYYRPYVQHRVVHHYRPVHRTVVVHRPQPVYYQSVHPNTGAILVGAVLGAVIGHHIASGY